MAKRKPQNKGEHAEANSQETKYTKPETLHERWNKTALHNKLLVIVGAVAALGAIIAAAAYIVSVRVSERHYSEEHKPLVILSRPPRFLQPFTCSVNGPNGGLVFGNMEVFAKNVGNETANDVVLFPPMPKFVTEHKTGNPFFDDPPQANCGAFPNIPLMEFSLLPGEEKSLHVRQGVGTLPPIKNGEAVQLYSVGCVFYLDGQNQHHATCTVYQFSVPSDNPIDRIWGTPTLFCDGKPKIGAFVPSMTQGCSK